MKPGRALVTGGAQRLGAAMATHLAEHGWDVAVHYNSSRGAAEDVAASVEANGQRGPLLQADLLDPTQMSALVGQASAALGGPLTLLVNNASIFEHDTIETATLESWHRHFGSNLQAPFLLTQAFARQVPKGVRDGNGEPIASGCIVNMIDQRVFKLTPEFSTYTIAKVGLWTLTQTAAQGLAPDIRVNGIGPGPTLRGGRQSEEHFAKQRRATVLQRGANAADICSALDFILVTPSLTGQLICIDGGQHLGWQTPDVVGVE
ncbi:MAG: SDR family oxidoreductase [Pseudomonadota bacterium]